MTPNQDSEGGMMTNYNEADCGEYCEMEEANV